MTLDNIKRYILRNNELAVLFGGEQVELTTLTREQYKYLEGQLEGDLSPENLTCDGELPNNEVFFKSKHLNNALLELHKFALLELHEFVS
jgi:hypothetical protein